MRRALPVPSAPALALALALAATAGSPPSLLAQPPADSGDDGPMAWASIVVEPGLPTRLHLTGRTAPDPAITAALERMAGRPPETSEFAAGWSQWTIVLPAPTRSGLVLRQEFALNPLLGALEGMGQHDIVLMVQHPVAGFVDLAGARVFATRQGSLHATLPTGPPHRPLRLELGWRGLDVGRAAALLLLALLAPIAAGFVVWRRSVSRDRAPEAWFGRAQALQAITMAGWVLWMSVVEATRVTDLTAFAFPGPGWSGMATGPMWIVGFLPAALVLVAIGRRVTRRLRGYDPLPRGGGLAGQMRALSVLVLVVVAISTFAAGNPRAGVFALLGAIAAGILLPGARGPLGTTPQALSSGALRDRLFDLARRAGVKLRELYVVPMRRERMANAFAVNGGVVMVADELLDRMSRREVDAVLAHEISHLEHHHPMKMVLAGIGVWALVAAVGAPLGIPYGFPAAFVASWLTYLFVARRFEFAADAGAAALTGDPEAVISGLGHLARLNDAPLLWGRAWRWLITHPTTEARALAVGRRAGLAPERVADLLASGLPPAERYGHPERPGEGARVFSTAWKTAALGRLALTTLAAAVVAPAATLALAGAFGFRAPHAAAVLAGSALAFGAVLVAHDRLAARPVSRLEEALRRRLGGTPPDPPRDPARAPGGAPPAYVALSPGDRPRVYEGFLDWDLGLLSIGPDRIRYRGEQIALDLPREAVRAIEVGAGAPGWIPTPRVVVRWSGPEGEEALTLRAADPRTVSAIGPASRALAARLRDWRDGVAVGNLDRGVQDAIDPPSRIGPVTARTPAEAAAPRDLPLLAALIGTFSAGASYLLGLDFWLGLDVFAAALIAVMAVRWPAMTTRERQPATAAREESRRHAA